MSHKHDFFPGSFSHALDGVSSSFKDEPNLRFHALAGIVVLLAGVILGLTPEKMAILVLTIFMVIVLELVNTEIEEIVNIISPDYSAKAKLIKDISAAIVLISAFASILVALLLFVPSIFPLLFGAGS